MMLSGKEYTMKDVSILGTKMLATKYLRDCKMEEILTWIGDEEKEKKVVESFAKFLSVILVESYEGVDVLKMSEAEVVKITQSFFASANAKTIAN